MSTHWVYDMQKMAAMTAGRETAAFLDPPADAFYSYPLGAPSPYGQQALALLQSLVETRGFSAEAYAARNFAVFGAPSFAAAGGYLDGSTKGFVRAVRGGAAWPSCGVDDAQANCIVRLPPLVAAFAGDAQLLPVVADMIRVTQASDTAVAWGTAAARVLEKVILGAAPPDAVRAVIADLQARDTWQQACRSTRR
jgi:ADP-ribosylglycohydrolase